MRRRETREGTTCDGYQKAVRRREKWKKALHMRRENQSSVRRGYAWHGVEPASHVWVPYVRARLPLERARVTISREEPRTTATCLGSVGHWRGLVRGRTGGLPPSEQPPPDDSLPSVHDERAREAWRHRGNLVTRRDGTGRWGLHRDGTSCPPGHQTARGFRQDVDS
jgi:hypothetical protein